jgi:hypothetical protein
LIDQLKSNIIFLLELPCSQCVLNRSSNQDAHYSCPRKPSNIFLLIFLLNHIVVYINNCSYKRQGILFKPNKVDRDRIQRTRCLCKSCVHLWLYISWMHARYADVLDKQVKTLQSTSLYHKLRPNYDNTVFWGIIRNWRNISPHANFLIIFLHDGFFLIFKVEEIVFYILDW